MKIIKHDPTVEPSVQLASNLNNSIFLAVHVHEKITQMIGETRHLKFLKSWDLMVM